MREVVVTGKDGETEETAQGLVGQVRIRWGPEDLPKAKSLDLICAQKDYSGCRARTDQRGQGWGMKTALLRQKELKQARGMEENIQRTHCLEDEVAIRGMDEPYKCKAEHKK